MEGEVLSLSRPPCVCIRIQMLVHVSPSVCKSVCAPVLYRMLRGGVLLLSAWHGCSWEGWVCGADDDLGKSASSSSFFFFSFLYCAEEAVGSGSQS